MDSNSAAVAVFGTIFVFGAPFAALIAWRYLAHRERMEMIRHGYGPPPGAGWKSTTSQMKAGIPPQAAQMEYADASAQVSLHKGIRLAMIGLALLIGFSFIGYSSDGGPLGGPTIHPGPWLLGGLIPMFVGIAQIISALLSGAQFGVVRTTMAPPSGPPPPPPGAGVPPWGPSATYEPPPQPHTGYEELGRPTPPPDRR
jgi:hypothetical protein